MSGCSHLDEAGNPRMVDVGGKPVTARRAVAKCDVVLGPKLAARFADGDLVTQKGSVVQVAVVAGISGAKQCPSLIPMCHPLPLDHCAVTIEPAGKGKLGVTCTCATSARTGVEMEALTGCATAALTVYDMCKGIESNLEITNLRLVEKSGGVSGRNKKAGEA